jgi:hypothetical protein
VDKSAATEREKRLSECYECERPFPQPVSEEQAREDWGDAADDEIAYHCGACADDFDGTAANAR